MKQLILALCVSLTATQCFAQSNLAVYDAEGDRIGSVLGFHSGPDAYIGPFIQIYMPDSLITEINQKGEVLYQELIYYNTQDCSGQPYIAYTSNSWMKIGNVIFSSSSGDLASLDFGTSPVPAFQIFDTEGDDAIVWRKKFDCGGPSSVRSVTGTPDYLPVTILNSEQYGFPFTPPLELKVERPDALFCNGFESCPQ
jgi:hypothetical protein